MGKAAIGAALPAVGGALGGLFGDGGQDPTTTRTTQLSPQQQALQDQLVQQGQQFTSDPFRQFQGPRTAQFGGEFQQGVDRLTGIDPRLEQGFGGAAGGLGIGQDFFQNLLGQQGPGGPQFDAANIARFTNPFQQQQIDATRAGFARAGEQGLNTIGDQFTQQGAFGGSRQGVAEGTFAGNLARQEEEAVGGIRQRGFEDAARRLAGEQGRFDQFTGQQQGAAGSLANLGFGGLSGLQNIFQQAGRAGIDIGQLLRGVGQQDIDRQREAFGEERQFGQQNLGILQSILGGLPQQGGTTVTEQQAGTNPATAGAGIGSILGSFFGGGGGGAPQINDQQIAQQFGGTPNNPFAINPNVIPRAGANPFPVLRGI